jgi:hypothetical protein
VNEDRAREAVDHLQAAAREVGAAVRAFLDAMAEAQPGRSWFGLLDELAKGLDPERDAGDPRDEGDDGDEDDDGDGYTAIGIH